jgi:hypothetical protein
LEKHFNISNVKNDAFARINALIKKKNINIPLNAVDLVSKLKALIPSTKELKHGDQINFYLKKDGNQLCIVLIERKINDNPPNMSETAEIYNESFGVSSGLKKAAPPLAEVLPPPPPPQNVISPVVPPLPPATKRVPLKVIQRREAGTVPIPTTKKPLPVATSTIMNQPRVNPLNRRQTREAANPRPPPPAPARPSTAPQGGRSGNLGNGMNLSVIGSKDDNNPKTYAQALKTHVTPALSRPAFKLGGKNTYTRPPGLPPVKNAWAPTDRVAGLPSSNPAYPHKGGQKTKKRKYSKRNQTYRTRK